MINYFLYRADMPNAITKIPAHKMVYSVSPERMSLVTKAPIQSRPATMARINASCLDFICMIYTL
jgi:hypothetical protein